MKLSERLQRDHESGDFGRALGPYISAAVDLESALSEAAARAERAEAELKKAREQEPFTHVDFSESGPEQHCKFNGKQFDERPDGTYPLYLHPIPATAAQVPQAIPPIAWFRKRSDGGIDGPLMDNDSRMCDTRRKEWTPLYEKHFSPDWRNYRQGFNDGIEEVQYELKQLCKDFSDLQNRPYMGDVYAQVDAICARALLQESQA